MTTTNLGDGIVLHHGDEWRTGREVPHFASMRARSGGGNRGVYEFIGHHTGGAVLGDPDPRQWLRNIWHFHVEGRRYSDIAYNSAVDMNGDVWELRDNAFVGAHTLAHPSDGLNHNDRGHGIVLLRTNAGLDDRAKLAFRKMYGLVALVAGRLPGTLVHWDVDHGTECPGADMRDFFRNGIFQPAPGPAPAPGPTPAPPARPPYPGTPLREGSRGSAVATWQERMVVLGHGPLTIDGVFGAHTDAATRQFQTAKRLAVDGVVGPASWTAAW